MKPQRAEIRAGAATARLSTRGRRSGRPQRPDGRPADGASRKTRQRESDEGGDARQGAPPREARVDQHRLKESTVPTRGVRNATLLPEANEPAQSPRLGAQRARGRRRQHTGRHVRDKDACPG